MALRPETLARVLQYKNTAVVNSFLQQNPGFTTARAELLFQDLRAWMWLAAQRKTQGKKTLLFGPLLALDSIWHVFILHTRDYMKFSEHYFGEYFHHDIEPVGHEHFLEEEECFIFLEECMDHLGEAWVERCFNCK